MGTLVVVALSAVVVASGLFLPAAWNALFDGLAAALGFLGPLGAVSVVSAAAGVAFIAAFPHVSAQKGIVAVKDRIKCHLLAIRIYQDEIRTVGRGVAGALGWNFAYLALNVLPILALGAPFLLLFGQLSALYAYKPLPVGEERVVLVELRSGVEPKAVQVALPDGATLVNRANMVGRLAFTVRPERELRGDIVVRHGGVEVRKVLESGTRSRRLGRVRTSEPLANFFAARDPMLGFAEPTLPASSFARAVVVPYPEASFGPLPGGEIGIMVVLVVVSMAVGFALKGVFGVEL